MWQALLSCCRGLPKPVPAKQPGSQGDLTEPGASLLLFSLATEPACCPHHPPQLKPLLHHPQMAKVSCLVGPGPLVCLNKCCQCALCIVVQVSPVCTHEKEKHRQPKHDKTKEEESVCSTCSGSVARTPPQSLLSCQPRPQNGVERAFSLDVGLAQKDVTPWYYARKHVYS